jgi:hypothetical protein
MPIAPEGYKYDMSKSPPELVKKGKELNRSTKPKAKPTMEEQVDLIRCKYGSSMRTDDIYNVP